MNDNSRLQSRSRTAETTDCLHNLEKNDARSRRESITQSTVITFG